MYQQPSRKYTILLSESSIVLLSLISAFFPGYLLVAIILYTILIFILTSYTMTRKTKARAGELKTPLFRENNAMKIAMADKELSKELMQQMRSTLVLFITFPLIFILFPLYASYISPLIMSLLGNSVITRFINYFIMYNFVFAVISVVRLGLTRVYKPVNILLPQRFTVYSTGILANNKMFIKFTEDHCYKYNPVRKFIEIRTVKNPGFKIKLYSENITKLKEKIVEKKILRECKE